MSFTIPETADIKVLDHGYVKYVAHLGGDEDIVAAARMSTDKGFQGWGTPAKPGDEKLLEFLYKMGHSTPFEMCEFAVEVQAPIFVFREWHRHRTFSYSELSARYTQMPNIHYVPEASRFEPKVTANKQESSKPYFTESDARLHRENVEESQRETYFHYDEMIAQGVPREVARINTPVSRYSRMRAKTDLRNWLGFLKLRMDKSAQYEIRCFAEACASIIKALWPRTYALFEEYDLNGVRLSRSDVAEMRDLFRGDRVLPREILGDANRLSEGFLGKFRLEER